MFPCKDNFWEKDHIFLNLTLIDGANESDTAAKKYRLYGLRIYQGDINNCV